MEWANAATGFFRREGHGCVPGRRHVLDDHVMGCVSCRYDGSLEEKIRVVVVFLDCCVERYDIALHYFMFSMPPTVQCRILCMVVRSDRR